MANVDGDSNNAVGFNALGANLDGLFNQAMGALALSTNASGASNIAIGDSALLAKEAARLTPSSATLQEPTSPTGAITSISVRPPVAESPAESGTIRIGDPEFISACFVGGISGVGVAGDPVVVDANGQLGVAPAGHPLSVKELLKERQVVQQLKATTEKQAARIALQEGQIQTLTAALKQQAEQIQKVSAQLEMVRAGAASGGESIKLLSRSAVREVSASWIQLQPPREPARRLFCLHWAASLCEALIPMRAWMPLGRASHREHPQIIVWVARDCKLSCTALCRATKGKYGPNDEFQMIKNPPEPYAWPLAPIRTIRLCFTRSQRTKSICDHQFEHRLEGIQTLNERAQRGELHISALSMHACTYVADKYALLRCGASMGN